VENPKRQRFFQTAQLSAAQTGSVQRQQLLQQLLLLLSRLLLKQALHNNNDYNYYNNYCYNSLRSTSNTRAVRCQILRLKYIKFDFHWGSAPEAYSAPTDH